MKNQPFYQETEQLFKYVSEHDFTRLSDLCDDDFGIIDIDPEGKSKVIKNRQEWENWFHGLFEQLDALEADTWTDITDYSALKEGNLGYSVVYFTQYLKLNQDVLKFDCVVTIIWKFDGKDWKESRWHASMLKKYS